LKKYSKIPLTRVPFLPIIKESHPQKSRSGGNNKMGRKPDKKPTNRQQIIDAFKGVDMQALANAMRVSNKKTLYQIAEGRLLVSALRARAIEQYTNGKVSAKVLRPDIFFKE
jgi:hypothetical protein